MREDPYLAGGIAIFAMICIVLVAVSPRRATAHEKSLHYQRYAIPALLAKNPLDIPTRVEVTGYVVYKAHEADGDVHLWICMSMNPPKAELKPGKRTRTTCVVAEAMPDLPGPLPTVAKIRVGDKVTEDGISRWDGEHQWLEAGHPIEKITIDSEAAR